MSRTTNHNETVWLSIDQVAEQLGCSPWTVRRQVSRGEIRAYRAPGKSRLIRIKSTDLDKAMRPVTPVAANLGDDDAQA